MKNEKPSKRVASIAARMLRNSQGVPDSHAVIALDSSARLGLMEFLAGLGLREGWIIDLGTIKELQSVLASDLTQSPSRKAAKGKKR